MQYAWASQEIPVRVNGYLEEGLKYPVLTRSMAAKRSKILEQPPETLPYNSGLFMLFINMQISFFLKRT